MGVNVRIRKDIRSMMVNESRTDKLNMLHEGLTKKNYDRGSQTEGRS